ncbi:aryl-alcohol dehydrogenase-like predicted oxidoreductase [Modicisalibacter xianhensis]|uniref:Aryl-alcohol dehydrogenase-like predicted oxidoreductase n=1 Tax=Modicisalibacter xianhensis TaxID=442341 RepID=A0A4R8FQ70_9GAMM|nr:aldo/keto reductase [Halomonas xianhensis]TDX27582.1 aryl-alcohol dehydrogenase-like predicted oxidoreductase [Halomonas xianhensis]
MQTLEIANTGISTSRIGLGTWAMGGRQWGGTDDAQAIRTIHAALDRGITLIDTAPAYGFGHAEEVVGKALAESGQRDRVVIATKAALEWGEGIAAVVRNATQARIDQEVEDSLRRLGVEAIDLYQVHWPDPKTPMEETARTMERLYRDGKIRAIGVSNFSPEQCDAFREVAPLHTVQPPLNLFEREAERDIIPYAKRQGLTMLTYGALCRGLLSGKMHRDSAFNGDDLRNNDPKFQQPRFDQYLAAVDALDRFAQERHGKRVLELAVRWLLDRHDNGIALWGARRPDQVDPVSGIADWQLSAEDVSEIERIVDEHVTDPVGPEFMAPPTRDV